MAEQYIAYPCPYCRERYLETVATLPYVRGFLLAVVHGHKKFIGCRKCIRQKLLQETATSLFIGWFSPTALILNPIFIVYGLLRSLFVSTNVEAVRAALKEAGVPEPRQPVDLVRIGYGLAAAMIAADHKVDPAELNFASEIGTRLFQGFDDAAFRDTVSNHKSLPEATELASVLSGVLDNEGKVLVFNYLQAIAAADGAIAPEEQKLLGQIADGMQLVLQPSPPLEVAA